MTASSTTAAALRLSGNIVDVHQRRVYPGTVVIDQGRIVELIDERGPYATYLAPGFIDAHVHIESSMLVPAEFARLAVVHGTVGTVSDPHEIANACGIDGVEAMLASARQAPLKVLFGAPSCVPATQFDHAGALLDAGDVAALLARPEIGYLSEMMNYPGVVGGDLQVLAKLAAARAANKPIDGHAPGLRGEPLARYVKAGITTDHECTTIDEAREKMSLGMKILIREGSAAKNFEALWPLLREAPGRVMLCSDDKHPNDLLVGHVDALVRRAIALGVDPMDAWQAASLNAVEHYRMNVGLLRPGDPADLIEVDDLCNVRVLRTWIDGALVAERGKPLVPRVAPPAINQFAARAKSANEFVICAMGQRLRVIEALDGQLVTRAAIEPARINDGLVVSDPVRDVLKIALVDRYHDGAPVVAMIKNFGLKRGAIASSVSHDSHNILAVGVSNDDLARAVNLVIEARGGVAVADGNMTAVLPLPVAGLMSDGDAYHVAREYERIDALAKRLGSPLAAPFMTLSFMALLVIPSLKLGPQGLFDVEKFEPVSLFV